MSYSPIAYTIPQYDKAKFKNWWLKAYEQGTTTPVVISYDAAGTTTAARIELNAEGFPVTAGGDLFIPHISGDYDLWSFPTAAEADANDTTNAYQFADNINSDPVGAVGGAYYIDSPADFATASYDAGQVVHTRWRTTRGDGGQGEYLTKTAAQAAADGDTIDEIGAGFTLANGNVAVLQWSTVFDAAWYGVSSGDITTELQAMFDNLPSGTEIKFPKDSYSFTNVTSSKAFIVDFSGSSLTLTPSAGSLSASTPAIDFRGILGTAYPIATATAHTDFVTLSTAGNDVNFSVGDYVIIKDARTVQGWDYPTGSTANPYSEHAEINQVKSVSSGVITLSKPIEWPYSNPDSATIAVITTNIIGAEVKNAYINEPDPGAQYTGSVVMGPNLISFQYCVAPKITNVHADGYQLRAYSFVKCLDAYISFSSSANPYRPTIGGHGYTIEFDRCTNALAYRCVGVNVRHVVDNTQSYDTGSSYCTSYDTVISAFTCHGQGSKRCFSKDDTVYGANAGWGTGNPAFNADHDWHVINPRLFSTERFTSAFFIGTLSTGTRIINPYVFASKTVANAFKCISINSGATDIKVIGGTIDLSQTLGSASDSCVAIDGVTSGSDIVSISPSDVEIMGVRLVAPVGDNTKTILVNNIAGNLIVRGCEILCNNALHDPIRVFESCDHIDISDNDISGTWRNGIIYSAQPTTTYVNNRYSGTFTAEEALGAIAVSSRFKGPFADDAAASAGGIQVGESYRLASGGLVVRLV